MLTYLYIHIYVYECMNIFLIVLKEEFQIKTIHYLFTVYFV